MKKILLPLILLLLPLSVFALNLTYPKFPGAPDINNLDCGNALIPKDCLTPIVAWLYVFIVGISGLAAFVMIVWGGVEWLVSQGSPEQTTGAKDKIKMALLGLLLVLASFLILQVINPELTLLQEPKKSGTPSTSGGAATQPASGTGATSAFPAGAEVFLCAKDKCAEPKNERFFAGDSFGLKSLGTDWDNRATSLEILGLVDVLLYENSGGTGRVICFARSVEDLDKYIIGPGTTGANGWDNDVSSLEIMPEGKCKIPGITVPTKEIFTAHNIEGVLLCQNKSCAGTEGKDFFVTNKSLADLAIMEGGQNWNDKVAALQIIGPDAALLYEHARDKNDGGKVICFPSSSFQSFDFAPIFNLNEFNIIPPPSKNTWEDDVSSIELLRGIISCPSLKQGVTFPNRNALMSP